MAFQRILIAIDGGSVGAYAAIIGIDLARSLHAEFALVNVIDPSEIFAPETGTEVDDFALRAEQDGTRVMTEFCAQLPAGTEPVQYLPRGAPGSEIVKTAKEWQADLIVIGSHGRRGLTRAMLGSVAEAVMRHAACPVLVVKTKE